MTHDELHPFDALTEGRRIRFTDLGFGELLAHPRDGQEATIAVGYRRDAGLVVRFDDDAATWIHPTEATVVDDATGDVDDECACGTEQAVRHDDDGIAVGALCLGDLMGEIDGERFCDRCLAGVDSTQHHEQCVATGHADDGHSAPRREASHAH